MGRFGSANVRHTVAATGFRRCPSSRPRSFSACSQDNFPELSTNLC